MAFFCEYPLPPPTHLFLFIWERNIDLLFYLFMHLLAVPCISPDLGWDPNLDVWGWCSNQLTTWSGLLSLLNVNGINMMRHHTYTCYVQWQKAGYLNGPNLIKYDHKGKTWEGYHRPLLALKWQKAMPKDQAACRSWVVTGWQLARKWGHQSHNHKELNSSNKVNGLGSEFFLRALK